MTDETVIPPAPEPAPARDLRAEAAAEDAATAALAAAPPEPEPEPSPDPEPEPEPEPVAAKPRKTVEEVMRSRIGHLTKTAADIKAERDSAVARAEAAERLLNASGGGEPTPAPEPNAPRTYTQAEFQAEAARVAAHNEFTRQSNAMYDAGKTAHPETWEMAVGNLNDMGIMSPTLLEAAMATDSGAAVINHLGTDPEEAARIVSLPPARMGAELAKLAIKLSTPAKKDTPVSRVPAPITPLRPNAAPTVNLERISEGDDMAVYAAARAAQGSRWAKGMGAK